MLDLLVDAGGVRPLRLADAGGSYGRGRSRLLVTAVPWDTPADSTDAIELAAAAPCHGWTDVYGSSAPNGLATDGVDQSASHESHSAW